MDLPSSHQVTSGPMTRERARDLKTKVNSLLSELPLSMHENWLLPQVETLCVIRCLEEGDRPTTLNGQDSEGAKFMGQEEGDAEHPTIIPMDAPTPPTTPLGPMKRARAKAIEDKVNSLLSELPLSMRETWLLPKVRGVVHD